MKKTRLPMYSAVASTVLLLSATALAVDPPRFHSLPQGEAPWLTPPTTVSIDPATGTASDEIPLPLPPLPESFGTSAPLRLRYSHRAGNGPLGYGWTLELGHIAPSSAHGVEPYLPSHWDAVYPTGSAELIAVDVAGHTRYRSRIQRTFADALPTLPAPPADPIPTSWDLWDARGIHYQFAATDTFGSDVPRWWGLTSITDQSSNTISASYQHTSGRRETLLSKVDYVSNASANFGPSTELRFDLTSLRSDAFSVVDTGVLVDATVLYRQIEVWIRGSHQYNIVFSYSSDTNQQPVDPSNSRLVSIAVEDPDGGHLRVLRTFTYMSASSGSVFSQSNSQYGQPNFSYLASQGILASSWNVSDLGVRSVDINGDGFDDILNNLHSIAYASADGSGTFGPPPPGDGYQTVLDSLRLSLVDDNGVPQGPVIQDIDGDGRPDIIAGETLYINTGTTWVKSTIAGGAGPLLNSTGWVERYNDRSYTTGLWVERTITAIDLNAHTRPGIVFADVNGDGHADLIEARIDHSSGGTLDHGSPSGTFLDRDFEYAMVLLQQVDPTSGQMLGFAYSETYTESLFSTVLGDDRYGHDADGETAVLGFNEGLLAADVNGDGLVDLVSSRDRYVSSGTTVNPLAVFLNNGNGWTFDTGYSSTLPPGFVWDASTGDTRVTGGAPFDLGVRWVDYNGDGLLDIIQAGDYSPTAPSSTSINYAAYLNSGHGWRADPTEQTNLSDAGVVFAARTSLITVAPIGMGWLFGDFNGDDETDIFRLASSPPGPILWHQYGTAANLLSTETNELSGVHVLTYRNCDAFGLRGMGTGLPSPRRVSVAVGSQKWTPYEGTLSLLESRNYSYASGVFNRNGFRGFSTVTMTNAADSSAAAQVTIGHYVNAETEPESTLGLPTEVDWLQGTSSTQPLRRTQYNYAVVALDGARSQAYASALSTTDYDTSSGSLTALTHVTDFTVDSYGNTLSISSPEVAGDPETGWTATLDWLSSPDGHDVSVLDSSAILDRRGSIFRQTFYSYSDLGNPTHATRIYRQYTSAGAIASTALEYDRAGRPTTITDPDGFAVGQTYSFDEFNPSTRSYGGGIENERATWDPTNGRLATSTDRDGRTTSYVRDLYGLLQQITRPGDETSAVGSASFGIVGSGTDSQRLQTRRPFDEFGDDLYLEETFDGFGRIVRAVDYGLLGFGTSLDYVQTFTQYDTNGRVAAQSVPYAMSESPNAHRYAYDALGRVVSESVSSHVTTFKYGLDSSSGSLRPYVTTVDPRGLIRTLHLDGHGNVIDASEYDGARQLTTQWGYDLSNQLTTVVDPAGAGSGRTYDLLGRMTAASDPDLGTTSYQISPGGRLQREVRPDGTWVMYSPDALGRTTSRAYSDGSSVTLTFGTDASNNTIGRIQSATATRADGFSNSVALVYDAQGRVLARTTSIAGTDYSLTFNYWSDGSLYSVYYPDGYEVTYQPDWRGRASVVQGSDGVIFAENIVYNARDQLTHIDNGNGLPADYAYDAAMGWETSATVGLLQSAVYHHDLDGNLSDAEDAANPLVSRWDYSYNLVNQLTHASRTDVGSGSPVVEDDAYDLAGNLVRRGGFSFDVDPVRAHEVTCMRPTGTPGSCPAAAGGPGVSATYDSRGNVIQRNSVKLQHDLQNRLVEVDDPSVTGGWSEQIVYDPFGETVERVVPGDPTVVVAPYFEQHTGYFVRQILLNGQRLASQTIAGAAGSPVMGSLDPVSGRGELRGGRLMRGGLLARSGLARGTRIGFGVIVLAALLWLARRGSGLFNPLTRRWLAGLARYEWQRLMSGRLVPRRRLIRLAALSALVFGTFLQRDLTVGVAHAQAFVSHTVWYHYDAHGSAGLITDETGSIVRRVEYQPFGQVNHEQDIAAYSTGFARAGYEFSERSQLADVSQLGARHYDAALGRFLEADNDLPNASDPHQLNRFAYAAGNPATFADPTGHGIADTAEMLAIWTLTFVALAITTSTIPHITPATYGLLAVGSTVLATAIVGGAAELAVAVGAPRDALLPLSEYISIGLLVAFAAVVSGPFAKWSDSGELQALTGGYGGILGGGFSGLAGELLSDLPTGKIHDDAWELALTYAAAGAILGGIGGLLGDAIPPPGPNAIPSGWKFVGAGVLFGGIATGVGSVYSVQSSSFPAVHSP